MKSTKDVIDHHLQAFANRDLKGVLSDYAQDAVFFTPQGTLIGPDAFRPLFQGMIAEFSKPGATFRMKQQFVQADYAYILWDAETADNLYELGTDTFVVQEGKIVAQSFTGKITPKTRAQQSHREWPQTAQRGAEGHSVIRNNRKDAKSAEKANRRSMKPQN